jgi:cytochrome c553
MTRNRILNRIAFGPRRGLALASVTLLLAACSTGQPDQKTATVEGTVHVCSSCHGFDGRSVSPTFPRLAGQQKDYLEVQLKAFRDKTRADPHAHTYMWGMAAHLSDDTISGIAAYYAAKPPAEGTPGNAADMAAGKKIYEEGIEARNVPVCKACHGEHGEGNGAFPRLASQHQEYLEEQLGHFASNARANELMHENSKNLTPDEAREVAAYMASQ